LQWVARADDHAFLIAKFTLEVAAGAAGLFRRTTRRQANNFGEFVLPMDGGGANCLATPNLYRTTVIYEFSWGI